MTVFKTYLKILNKNKFVVILYTVILLIFGASNMKNSESTLNFNATKPDIYIINEDTNGTISKDLVKYLTSNCKIKNIKEDENSINDAVFYREVNYVVYIPKNYTKDFIDGKKPSIEVKSSGDYKASLAEMILKRYIKNADIYRQNDYNEEEIIDKVNETLSKDSKIEVTTKLDTNSLSRASFYFNFASYSILACLIYVISLIISIFNSSKIKKRTLISSINYRKFNNNLFLSNCIYAIIVWLFYIVIGFILLGNTMLSNHGIMFITNSFIFTISATSLAFTIGNLVNKKDSINGIMNVVALGSSFLCGAFVPQDMLPNTVLKIGHLIPTYYYIENNNNIANIEIFTMDKVYPLFINMFIMLGFAIIFILLTNIITKLKRKIG